MTDNMAPGYLEGRKIRKVRVWGKGQFTIPAEIRERLDIKEDSYLEVFQIGRAIVLTPERLVVKELADSFQKEMDKNGIDLEQLLQELREGSHEYETD
ncbi:MAG: AbrB family transcriptional regulator [Peptococcaceae bacterium BICA1-7]|nr:MAG: AbrB family transcriptional regulator [Peptococcaceae bacterium BICA1-7]HBV97182.1 AbrB family transcriptional regulator [Desulfotomaculum sp.]